MDYHCPARNTERQGRPVRAYLLEPDIPEDEQMVELEYVTSRQDNEPASEDLEEEDPTLDEAGNAPKSHARVGVM